MRIDPTNVNCCNLAVNTCPDYLVPNDMLIRSFPPGPNAKVEVPVTNPEIEWDNFCTVFVRCPPVEIIQNQESYVLYFDTPGCKRDDLHVRLTDNTNCTPVGPNGEPLPVKRFIMVCGERRPDTTFKRDRLSRTHPMWGKFCRTIQLPPNCKCTSINDIKCKIEDGVLKVVIPKIKPDTQVPCTFNECPMN